MLEKTEIERFKKALKEGVVSFAYEKRDGSIRNAKGTLNGKLIPAAEETVAFKCSDIQWDCDTNEQLEALPKKATVKLDAKVASELTEEGIESLLTDALTEEFGFCLYSFEYAKAERKPKKLAEGTIFYYDTEKLGFRSFNESQLIQING